MRTSDDRDVQWRALNAEIAAPENGPQEPGVGGGPLLGHLVTAVELRAPAGRRRLRDRKVAFNRARVAGAAAGVLALVANVLVPFAVTTCGGD